MKSAVFVAAAATLLTAATAVSPHKLLSNRQTQQPAQPPMLGTITVQGCYKSAGDLVFNNTLTFNSLGGCADKVCLKVLGLPVAATSAGNMCYCGKKYPPKSTKVADSKCNIPCTGFGEVCGGIEYWTVYNTGKMLVIESSEEKETKSSSSEATKTATQTPIDMPKETVIVDKPDSEDSEKKGGGSNTAGIAAGVVVGVVVLGAAAAGIFFYLRRKKNREIEEEHRRNAAVNSFMGKPPSSSGMSITDSRLDPVMAQRRMSDGSIADNQDYSRRILRVTNA